MSKIRDTLLSNCEKKFLVKCLTDFTRLSGRAFDEFRPLEIKLGKDWGCCYVFLGDTKVFAQTSCEIQTPKSSRPSEGILNVNIELSPLAAPHFEPSRQSELSVLLNRLLEKCVKDSKAVDLESLCIKMSEKVWALRVDLNVLNHEGNILDCASIALLASLAHFRRPDVTCDGEEFVIHSYKQRDPILTVLHHYPVCVTYSIFNGGEFILADPNLLEEGTADATLTVGLNGFRELCGLHLGGKAELSPQIILSTVNKAAARASKVIEQIKEAIAADSLRREKKESISLHDGGVKASEVVLDCWTSKSKSKAKKRPKKKKKKRVEIEVVGEGSAAFVPEEKKEQVWEIEDSEEDDLVIVENPRVQIDIIDSGSEEDDVVVLEASK